MNPKPERRLTQKFAGFLLLLLGITAAYWWFYKLGPTRRLSDPEWLRGHSEATRWAEEQKDYQRLGRSPDLYFRADRIGYYGDKSWCLWLAERAENSQSFRVCGCTAYSLALMVNRDVLSTNGWLEAHHGWSQEQWIQGGFSDFGLRVQLPPSTNDTLPLLRVLGQRSWNFLTHGRPTTNAPGTIPSYVKYNAFRWLRDSGFQPARFIASNPVFAADPLIVAGLLDYSQWHASFPAGGGLGTLDFGRDQIDIRAEVNSAPLFVSTGFKMAAIGVIMATIVAGAWLTSGGSLRSTLVLMALRFLRK